MLKKVEGSQARTEVPENFAFENTTCLITEGILEYRKTTKMFLTFLF